MPIRRRWIIVAAAVAGALLIAGVAMFWIAPVMAASRIREEIARRAGVVVILDDVSFGFATIHLTGLRLTGIRGGVSVAIERVSVAQSPWAALVVGPDRSAPIAASGIEVVVTADDPNTRASVAAIREALRVGSGRGGSGADEQAAASARRPLQITLDGLDVRVDDAHGTLVTVEGGQIALRTAGLSASARELLVTGTHAMAVRDVELEVARTDDGLRVKRLAASGGRVTYGEREDATSTVARLRRLRELVATGEGDTELEPAEDARRPGLMRYLAEDAELRLAGVDVYTHSEAGDRQVLRGLTTSVTGKPDDAFLARGTGSPAEGGTLRWNLMLWPRLLRGEGTVAFSALPLAVVAPFLPAVPWHEPEHSMLDGELVLEGQGQGTLAFHGRVELHNGALSSPRIAPAPVHGLEFVATGRGTWNSVERRLELAEGSLAIGAARVDAKGVLEWASDHYVIALDAQLPPTRCEDAIRAIPTDLMADVSSFSFAGTIGATFTTRIDSRELAETVLDFDVHNACTFQTVPALADLTRVEAPFLHSVVEPDGQVFQMTTGPGSGNWASIHLVSPFLIHAVLAHEDASFFSHTGFAPWAIRGALIRNLEAGRYVQGASTITMQLAKNLFLRREKTLARKVQEVFLTWWLESALDKRGILELYLNVIEYGPAVYGIRHASEHYFGRDPSELSPAESAFIASILPNPKLYHGMFERGTLSASLQNRMRQLLRHMHNRGRLDQAALDYGLAEIDDFHFRREGGPGPELREIPGSTAELPFASVALGGVRDPWAEEETWVEPEDVPEEESEDAPDDDSH